MALGVAVAVMIVAGLAVGLTRGAGIGGSSPPVSVPAPSIASAPAAPVWASLRSGGQPPTDVLDALVVPAGTTVTGRTNYDRGSGPFDRGVSLAAPVPYDQLVDFYRYELATHGWSSRTEASARGGPGRQLLAQHKSSDGFYWEVGVTVRRPADQPPGSAAPTQYDLRLLQVVED